MKLPARLLAFLLGLAALLNGGCEAITDEGTPSRRAVPTYLSIVDRTGELTRDQIAEHREEIIAYLIEGEHISSETDLVYNPEFADQIIRATLGEEGGFELSFFQNDRYVDRTVDIDYDGFPYWIFLPGAFGYIGDGHSPYYRRFDPFDPPRRHHHPGSHYGMPPPWDHSPGWDPHHRPDGPYRPCPDYPHHPRHPQPGQPLPPANRPPPGYPSNPPHGPRGPRPDRPQNPSGPQQPPPHRPHHPTGQPATPPAPPPDSAPPAQPPAYTPVQPPVHNPPPPPPSYRPPPQPPPQGHRPSGYRPNEVRPSNPSSRYTPAPSSPPAQPQQPPPAPPHNPSPSPPPPQPQDNNSNDSRPAQLPKSERPQADRRRTID